MAIECAVNSTFTQHLQPARSSPVSIARGTPPSALQLHVHAPRRANSTPPVSRTAGSWAILNAIPCTAGRVALPLARQLVLAPLEPERQVLDRLRTWCSLRMSASSSASCSTGRCVFSPPAEVAEAAHGVQRLCAHRVRWICGSVPQQQAIIVRMVAEPHGGRQTPRLDQEDGLTDAQPTTQATSETFAGLAGANQLGQLGR